MVPCFCGNHFLPLAWLHGSLEDQLRNSCSVLRSLLAELSCIVMAVRVSQGVGRVLRFAPVSSYNKNGLPGASDCHYCQEVVDPLSKFVNLCKEESTVTIVLKHDLIFCDLYKIMDYYRY